MINGRVMVTMQRRRTFRTIELPLVKRHIHDNPASTTPMTTPSSLWVMQELSTASYGFVGQHISKHSPRSIAYAFSQAMIFNHVFDIKIFTSNYPISQSEASAEFVKEVSPLVGDFEMLFSKFKSCFSPIFRAFDFSTQSSLQEFQPLFTFDEESRIAYDLTSAECGKIFKPNINPNFLRGRMLDLNFWKFTTEDSKPLPNFVLLDSQSLNFSFRNAMQYYWNVSNFAEFKPFVRQEPETSLRKGDAVYSTFETREALFFTFGVFDSAKEVLKSFTDPIRNILLRLGMNLHVFTSKVFVKVKSAKANLPILPSIYAQCKKLIINCLTNLKRINKFYFLLSRRILSVFIHYLNDHISDTSV